MKSRRPCTTATPYRSQAASCSRAASRTSPPHAATTYNFANDDRAPLLFISGGNDHILPPAVQQENFNKNVKHSEAITAYKLFPGRSHYTCGEEGWEAVADLALDWALAPTSGELS